MVDLFLFEIKQRLYNASTIEEMSSIINEYNLFNPQMFPILTPSGEWNTLNSEIEAKKYIRKLKNDYSNNDQDYQNAIIEEIEEHYGIEDSMRIKGKREEKIDGIHRQTSYPRTR